MWLSKLSYILFIKPVSRLPFRALYIISDVLYFALYKIAGYRKEVVWSNLTACFPDKREAELKRIMNAFYGHFCDLLVESVKMFTISEIEIKKRFVFHNPDVLNLEYDVGRSIILVGGHYSNWELFATGLNPTMKHHAVGIYQPLSNPFFDQLIQRSRGKFGLRMLPIKEVRSYFANDSKHLTATIFGADQSPTHSKKVFWTTFLNRETAVAVGTEHYARLNNYPVYFGKIGRLKRGHYTFEVIKITDTPTKTSEGEITKSHVQLLENQILEKPEFWLWTHKRWKRKRRDGDTMI